MNYKLFVITLLFGGSVLLTLCFAENTENMKSKYNDIINGIRAKQHVEGFAEIELKNIDPNQFLQVLKPYQDDPDWRVRRNAYWQAYRLAKIQKNTEITQVVTERLIKASTSGSLQEANQWLLSFTRDDFNESARQMLKDNLQSKNLNKFQVLFCGVADIQDVIPELEYLLIDEMGHQQKVKKRDDGFDWFYTMGWAARLARARMGIRNDIDKSIQLIEENIDKNNRFLLLHDLAYIRQVEAIESLKRYFLSDRQLPPTNPDMVGETWSHYMMPIMDDVLVNFPVKKTDNQKLDRLYSEDEVETAKKWIKEQKTWNIRR